MVKIVNNLFEKVIEPECIRTLKLLETILGIPMPEFSVLENNNNNNNNAFGKVTVVRRTSSQSFPQTSLPSTTTTTPSTISSSTTTTTTTTSPTMNYIANVNSSVGANSSEILMKKTVSSAVERLKLMNTDLSLINTSIAQMASLKDRISHILKNKDLIFFDLTAVEKSTEPEMIEHLNSIETTFSRIQQAFQKCMKVLKKIFFLLLNSFFFLSFFVN